MKVSDLIRSVFLAGFFALFLQPGVLFAEGSHSHSDVNQGYDEYAEDDGDFDEYGEGEDFEGSHVHQDSQNGKEGYQDMEGSH